VVSEIKLYHEDELKEGRENHDIYERLKKEIDQGASNTTSGFPPPLWRVTIISRKNLSAYSARVMLHFWEGLSWPMKS